MIAYFPYQEQQPAGVACSFVLSAQGLAPPLALASSVPRLVVIAPASLPRVFIWHGVISRPETLRVALGATNLGHNRTYCDLIVQVRGPATFDGAVAAWENTVTPSTSQPSDMFAAFEGIAAGQWTMAVAPAASLLAPCNVSFSRHGVRVETIASPVAIHATEVHLKSGHATLLSLPRSSPPDSYSALNLTTLRGACAGGSLEWMGDTFATSVGPFAWAAGVPIDSTVLWPPSFDSSIGPASQDGPYLLRLASSSGNCWVGVRRAEQRLVTVTADTDWADMGRVIAGELVLVHRVNASWSAPPSRSNTSSVHAYQVAARAPWLASSTPTGHRYHPPLSVSTLGGRART